MALAVGIPDGRASRVIVIAASSYRRGPPAIWYECRNLVLAIWFLFIGLVFVQRFFASYHFFTCVLRGLGACFRVYD